MNQQKLDQHIDALLRAAGSALRHYTMQKSLDDMRAAMKAAVEELAKDDSKRLDFLESNQLETDSAGDWNEEPTFGVHRVSGGRNDRNWHCLGRGETLRAAIDAAMQPPPKNER